MPVSKGERRPFLHYLSGLRDDQEADSRGVLARGITPHLAPISEGLAQRKWFLRGPQDGIALSPYFAKVEQATPAVADHGGISHRLNLGQEFD